MDNIPLFVALVTVAAYVQTVTGFALGLIVMGVATLFHFAAIPYTAVVISFISMFNIVLALRGNYNHIYTPAFWWSSVAILPSLVAGVIILNYMSSSVTELLRQILGLFIVVAAILLMLRPTPRTVVSGNAWHIAMGLIAGLFGGMFSTAGPPLVYHLYRQPLTIRTIKATLLAIFGITTIARVGYVSFDGGISSEMLWTALWSLPAIYLGTQAGRLYPPALSDQQMRRLAFILLAILGVMLLI